MPSVSKTQQRLFGWALACKRGEAKDCPENVKKLADSMSEEELEKYAKTSHEELPEKVKESLVECIEELHPEYLDLLEAEKVDFSSDVKTPAPLDKLPDLPPGYKPAEKKTSITPSLFKMPMGSAKHERRIMDFNEFLERINYKTHDSILQKGHGQNRTGKGA